VEFGGDRTFTPPFIPANQCVKNCSFTSGEAASVFVPFYAAGLLVPHGSAALILAGTLLGFAAGLMRIVQGAHFLSDVVFAGIFMGLSVVLLHRLVFRQVPFKWPLGALAGSP
jgi:lipid A 4'-phosphatase